METERLIIAVCFAIAAAGRLLTWDWHVKRDCEELAKRFGPSDDDLAIAQTHSMMWVWIHALVALAALFA